MSAVGLLYADSRPPAMTPYMPTWCTWPRVQ